MKRKISITEDEKRTIRSMNSMFLRVVYQREKFPNMVMDELTEYLQNMAEAVKKDQNFKTEATNYMYFNLLQEIDIGKYTECPDEVPEKVAVACSKLGISEENANVIRKFYQQVCDDLKENWRFNDKPEYVHTNMGDLTLDDYYEMIARQSGFDSYEDMKNNGLSIETPKTYFKEKEKERVPFDAEIIP